MKMCCTCKTLKDVSAFGKNKSMKDGLQPSCNLCRAEYRKANKEKVAEQNRATYLKYHDRRIAEMREYYSRTKLQKLESERERKRTWAAANRDKERIKLNKWRAANKAKFKAQHAKRRNCISQQKGFDPELDAFVFLEAAQLVLLRESAFRFAWHIDHIVPVQGKAVCGLHAWTNIQVIPASVNSKKSNKQIDVGPFGLGTGGVG